MTDPLVGLSLLGTTVWLFWHLRNKSATGLREAHERNRLRYGNLYNDRYMNTYTDKKDAPTL